MSNKGEKKSQFSRVYQRASKSPFLDHSTLLWLASAVCGNELDLAISYERYIYIHRETTGSVCGISVSKQILAENPEFEERYLDGVEMYAFLLLHIDEIAAFCELFKDEFETIFLLAPLDYFEVAERVWLEKISEA